MAENTRGRPNDTGRKKIKWTWSVTPDTVDFVQEAAAEANFSQGLILKILYEMCYVVAGGANESGLVDDKLDLPFVVTFELAAAYHAGLIDNDELERFTVIASKVPKEKMHAFNRWLELLLNDRRDKLQPEWAKTRERRGAERKASPVQLTESEQALIAMLADGGAKLN